MQLLETSLVNLMQCFPISVKPIKPP